MSNNAEMPNWREIQSKAAAFAHEWEDAASEDSEAKAFWVRFFDVFGVRERSLGMFEHKVRLLGKRRGKIDFFAPNKFLVEHKSRGEDLDAAFEQASDYFDALSEDEKPRFVIVSDFARFRMYDLEAHDESAREFEFPLKELPDHVHRFAFLTDEEVREYKEEEPITIRAVKAIGELYDGLKIALYTKEHISPLLTRFVFCCFADDTGIFNRNAVYNYLRERAAKDDAGIGTHIGAIFNVLNTPEDKRQKTMTPDLASLPYVNGKMFEGQLDAVYASREIQSLMLKCMGFNWSRVSPDVFGSMFQVVMDETARRNLGAHYTSEKNILKVINGLFLEDLHAELDAAKGNEAKLKALWDKLASITLLDPACGCGNFLVISYRELRRIELEILKRFYPKGKLPTGTKAGSLSRLSIEKMYGIEIEDFPAEVAKLSLYVMDHLTNAELGEYFGERIVRLPLKEQPHIMKGNALTMDWNKVVPKKKLTYILGNPPFGGSKLMKDKQREEIKTLFSNVAGSGVLDYVCGWYAKAADYIQGTEIACAFVSTNSITQGEQPAILWGHLKEKGIHIRFAHRTFDWANEAPNNAAVYCVIIGFDLESGGRRHLYEYDDIAGEPREMEVKRINPYLVDAPDVLIESRSEPLCDVPEIGIGNKPIDGGMYLFEPEQKAVFLKHEPKAEKFFRRWLGAEEFLNGVERWILWLGGAKPEELKAMPEVMRRIEAVRQYRALSKSAPTRELANKPTRFHVENMPIGNYIIFPRHSSENRKYIPLGFAPENVLVGDACLISQEATVYDFGILQSEMHMVWVRALCGRIKSDYRYSKDIVYNNFPWPKKPSAAQKKAVEGAAQTVLDAREKHQPTTLAALYDPNTMPADLFKAHKVLDKAVDACYGVKGFKSEPERLEFLFEKYKTLTEAK